MKAVKLMLSLAAMVLAMGAIACALIAYWDNLLDLCDCAVKKLTSHKEARHFSEEDDFGDFADVK